jgi:hypothetical protein
MTRLTFILCLVTALSGCDRNVEPFVEGEQPRQPDLSAIFPEGAERAAGPRGDVQLPEAPQRGGRGADPSSEAPPIRGVIRVADALADRVDSGGVLFLIARAGSAGPPLAVQRVAQPSFPLEFALGPEHRMIQTLPFAGELVLTARLDSDGDAGSRTPGDLQGRAAGVHAPGASGVVILLDEVL